MNDWVYLHGQLVKSGDAFISPRDRGFRFGDGIFETIPVFNGKPYQADFHLKRLQEGLKALQITVDELNWCEIAAQIISKNQLGDGFVRISISRGIGSKGYRPFKAEKPTIFIETMPRAENSSSMRLWLSEICKPPLNCLPSHLKTAQGLNSILALQEADTHECDEALLLTTEGYLCEAASGNLFWIKDDTLFTPALGTGCLNGATRHAIIRLHKTIVQSTSETVEALEKADAVFLTNSNWGIMPIHALEPHGWNWKTSHPLLDELKTRYQADIDASV